MSMAKRSGRVLSLAVVVLILLHLAVPSAAGKLVQQDETISALSDLPITFPIQTPEVAEYFNQVGCPQDIASFPAQFINLVPRVTSGQRMPGFAAWADAPQQLERVSDQVEWVMYNPEHWEKTPETEKENMVETVRQAAEDAHERGLQLMFAPDRQFAEQHLNEVAPYIDAVMLQGQRIQHDPQAFSTWIGQRVDAAKQVNADLIVFVQVGATLGSAQDMLAAIETVRDKIDGIAIWSMPRSLSVLQDFIELVRDHCPSDVPSTAAIGVLETPVQPTAGTGTPTPEPVAVPVRITPSVTPVPVGNVAEVTTSAEDSTATAENGRSIASQQPADRTKNLAFGVIGVLLGLVLLFYVRSRLAGR